MLVKKGNFILKGLEMKKKGKKKITYIIVTPVRNEEKYITKTIESVISQTILPSEWIIVNDGSKDGTERILNFYENKYIWIRIVNRLDRGYRKSGSGVVEAFYDGYYKINIEKWDFIVKLDGDLEFKNDYFERCFIKFQIEKKLGIAGGTVLNKTRNGYSNEKNPKFHVRGATKIYQKKCWQDIGGLQKLVGWDTLDEVSANMLGWKTKTFKDIEIVQNKLTGSADGQFKNFIKNGKANYICGYHPLFMTGKILKRLKEKPYFICSAGLFYGYFFSYIFKTKRVNNKKLIAYLRKQQINRIFGKNSIWY